MDRVGSSPESGHSAARLAAEQLFASMTFLPPESPRPVVIVRKTRLASLQASTPVSAEEATSSSAPDSRAPRSFRIPSQAPGAEATAEAAETASGSTSRPAAPEAEPGRVVALLGQPEPDLATVSAQVRHRRKKPQEMLPGPVVQVFRAPTEESAASTDAASGGLQSVEPLRRQLAELDSVFEDIRRAQAFEFEVPAPGSDEAWNQLWSKVSELRGSIGLV